MARRRPGPVSYTHLDVYKRQAGICLSFVALVGQFDPTSSRTLSKHVAPLFAAGDQVVMVGDYEYDVPFYLRARKNSWVCLLYTSRCV